MSPRIIAALLIALSSNLAVAQTPVPQSVAPKAVPELAENAPDRHVVVPGDTLWGIASKFLKDPARWSEVWKLNSEQVKNPHRIYPGQVIVLNRSGNGPTLSLEPPVEKLLPRVREESLAQAIPTIPTAAIESFLTRPLLMDDSVLESTLRVVGIQDGHANAAPGDNIYAVGNLKDSLDWVIYRPGKALTDPDTKEVLGKEVVMLGTARLITKGDPATFKVASSQVEINSGDRLMPKPRADIQSYPQHRPNSPIAAKILNLAGDAPDTGPLGVVSISKGKKDGLEVGHVLTLYRPGDRFKDRYKGEAKEVSMPEEKVGQIYLFRVFDRVSYALIMTANRPVTAGDVVRAP
ncbi:MAG: LysM peptidoglycan-binding domain-containing protein [Rhodocyclaceae bacterium]|nr:MAG: LysM peptidoglycan-binding domain-containing protein [Rhodocyclaceae bacterium]